MFAHVHFSSVPRLPVSSASGLGIIRRVVVTGAEQGYQVWEKFVKEWCGVDLTEIPQVGETVERSIHFEDAQSQG